MAGLWFPFPVSECCSTWSCGARSDKRFEKRLQILHLWCRRRRGCCRRRRRCCRHRPRTFDAGIPFSATHPSFHRSISSGSFWKKEASNRRLRFFFRGNALLSRFFVASKNVISSLTFPPNRSNSSSVTTWRALDDQFFERCYRVGRKTIFCKLSESFCPKFCLIILNWSLILEYLAWDQFNKIWLWLNLKILIGNN